MPESEPEKKSMKVEKSLLHGPQLRWGILAASGLNYAGIIFFIVFWRLDLVAYIVLLFGVSLMMGVILVDFERAIFYSFSGLLLGNALATAVYLTPYSMFGESVGTVNVATIVVLSLLAKHLLISIAPYAVGMILGCFIGNRLDENQLYRRNRLPFVK